MSPPTPQMLADMPLEKNGTRRRRSSSSSSTLAKTVLELSLKDPDTAAHFPAVQGKQSQCDSISQPSFAILRSIPTLEEDIEIIARTKTLVIELEQDDEFFQMLMRELNEITSVQEEAKIKFEKDVSNLEQRLNSLVGSSEKDLADGIVIVMI